MNGNIPQEGFWYLHQLFRETVDYMDVNIEDTQYDEEAVNPIAVNSEKDEHKQAIYLLSEVFADQKEEFQPMGTWAIEEPEPDIRYDNIEYFSNGIRDEVRFLGDEDVSYSIYHNGNGEHRWTVLEELSEGSEIKPALRKHYEDPARISNEAPYHQLHRKVLEDGVLPEDYQVDLERLLTDVGRKRTPIGDK